jgi:chromosomal replication initiator protein
VTNVWTAALGQLRTTARRSELQTYFEKITFVAEDVAAVRLAVPDAPSRDYISTYLLDQVQAAIARVANRPLSVQLLLADEQISTIDAQPLQATLALAPQPESRELDRVDDDALGPRFTFDTFVVGAANDLAAAAAKSVAERPGLQFNPLFIHGGVGIGKTHLLHAIGHLARQRQPGLRVRYVAAETYIDDLHAAWRQKDGNARADLRHHYRKSVDVLLVDDVQFLQGRDRVQEEFFHLFNALHQAGKQIVLTGDRYPSELQDLSDRLRSRFDWGLVAELRAPDRDLRVAILQRKALELSLAVPPDVVYYLADHLRNNVRELEGALNKLDAHARIGRRAIDLTLARSVLGPIIELPSRNLTVDVIQRVTAQHFNLKVADLKGARRHRSIVQPRMVAVFLTRKHTGMSFPDIGRAFGGRDHSTAIHACQKMEWLLATDPAIQAAVQAIEIALGK